MKNRTNKNSVFALLFGFVGLSLYGQYSMVNTIEIKPGDSKENIVRKAAHVVPSKQQLQALKDGYVAFIHFGPNTFTLSEWGSGLESPSVFDLKELHTDQWCKAIKDAGMKKVVLTVKHHDGFCLWQTRYTKHGIMSTPYKAGKGDVLKELSESCKKYNLKLGIYLSPADLYQIESPDGIYGNGSKQRTATIPTPVKGRPFSNTEKFTFDEVDDYNLYYLNQLFELLTEYGPISEVWLDGAHPKRKGDQKYNYLAWKSLIHALAPNAVIFGGEDIRWCGNESGSTRETEWNVVPYLENPHTASLFPDMVDEDLASREKLYISKYLHYQPAQVNTSIREGWFHRADGKQKTRTADDVFDMYERAVGGNSIFMLNVPPNPSGVLTEEDVSVLEEVGKRISKTYTNNLIKNAKIKNALADDNLSTYVSLRGSLDAWVTLDTPITINRFLLQEAVPTHGERVEEHVLEAFVDGSWKTIASATNIGYKRILRFPEVTAKVFRVRILKARGDVALATMAAFYYEPHPPETFTYRDVEGSVNLDFRTSPFPWKPHKEDAVKNLNLGLKIYYTTDGSNPTLKSNIYSEPFLFQGGLIKSAAYVGGKWGPIFSREYGIVKKDWSVVEKDSETSQHEASKAIDNDPLTYWQSEPTTQQEQPQAVDSLKVSQEKKPHFITIDLGKSYELKGFGYTPQNEDNKGVIEGVKLLFSEDAKTWSPPSEFSFANLIDNRYMRNVYFSPILARYVRLEFSGASEADTTTSAAEVDFYAY